MWGTDGKLIFVEDQNPGSSNGIVRLYALDDGLGNTTSTLMQDGNGDYVVKERYVYDPHGEVMFLEPDWDDYAHVANVAYDNDPKNATNKSIVDFKWLFGQQRWSNDDRLYHGTASRYDPVLPKSAQPRTDFAGHQYGKGSGANGYFTAEDYQNAYNEAFDDAVGNTVAGMANGLWHSVTNPRGTTNRVINSTASFIAAGMIDREGNGPSTLYSRTMGFAEGLSYLVASAVGARQMIEGGSGYDLTTSEVLGTNERITRGFGGLSQMAFVGAGLSATLTASVAAAEGRGVAAGSPVNAVGDDLARWLGPNAVNKRAPTSFVLQSEDGLRQLRLDLNGHGPYPPHAHLQIRASPTGKFVDAPGTPHHIYFSDTAPPTK